MDIFGNHWEDHASAIAANWREVVSEGDTVLIPGDISWAMKLEEAATDLEWIDTLPGTKIIARGNHDYWWSSISKVRTALPGSIIPLQHTAWRSERAVITGTRGWISPEYEEFDDEKDGRLHRRELHRLDIALKAASAIRRREDTLIVMLHFPPVLGGLPTDFSRKLSCSGVDLCIYGHIHNSPGSWPENLDTVIDGVRYMLVSADYLDFKPLRIL